MDGDGKRKKGRRRESMCSINRNLSPPVYNDTAYICRVDGFVLSAPALVECLSSQPVIGQARLLC